MVNKIKQSNKLDTNKLINEERVNILLTVLETVRNDTASKQLLSQDPATEGAKGIINLHCDIFF
jgi:hypothetical protein